MKGLLAVAVIVLLGFSAAFGQNCPDTAGQNAQINSTTDVTKFTPCTSLPGIIFGVGLTGNVSLPNLQTITRLGDDSTGIVITDTVGLISLSLPKLANFDADSFRFINNQNLTTFSAPSLITISSTSNVGVVFQNNPALTNVVLGLSATGTGELTVGGGSADNLDGAIGTLVFPNLKSAGDVRIQNNGIHSDGTVTSQLNIQLPALTTANSLRIINSSVVSFYAPLQLALTETLTVTSNLLANLTVNPVSFAGNIAFANNNPNAAGVTYAANFDAISNIGSDVSITNNHGLSQISLASLQYANGLFTITSNPDLVNFNQPKGLILNTAYTFSNNGPTSNAMTAIFGVQNATTGVSIQNNNFNTVTFPQLLMVSGDSFTFSFNVIQTSVTSTTTWVSLNDVQINSNRGALNTAFDWSGLYAAASLSISSNKFSGPVTLKLAQLYFVENAVNIDDNTGFNAVTFSNLGFITTATSTDFLSVTSVPVTYTTGQTTVQGPSFSISRNPGLATITTGGTWTANAILINNNPDLTTVTLQGLTRAQFIQATINGLQSITADQLTCVGGISLESNTQLATASFKTLGSAAVFQITNTQSSCTASVGTSPSGTCNAVCSFCPGLNTTCPTTDKTLQTAICGSSSNIFASSSCTAVPAPKSFSTTGATLTPVIVVPTTTGATTATANGGSTTATANGGSTTATANGGSTTATANGGGGTTATASGGSGTTATTTTGSASTTTGRGNTTTTAGSRTGGSSGVVASVVILAIALLFI